MQVENEAKLMIATGITGDQSPLLMGVVGPLFLEVPPIKVCGSGFYQRCLWSARAYVLRCWNGPGKFCLLQSKLPDVLKNLSDETALVDGVVLWCKKELPVLLAGSVSGF